MIREEDSDKFDLPQLHFVSCLLVRQTKWLSVLYYVTSAGFFWQKYSSSHSVSDSEHDAGNCQAVLYRWADWYCGSGIKEESCGLQVLSNCRNLDSWIGRIREAHPTMATAAS